MFIILFAVILAACPLALDYSINGRNSLVWKASDEMRALLKKRRD